MENNPLVVVLLALAYGYIIKLWFDDLKSAKAGNPNPKALPGATSSNGKAIAIAAIGGFILVGLETWGEIALGLSEQQKKMTALMCLVTLLAPFVEEIIFRGYIVIENRGVGARWLSFLVGSTVFALFHSYLWEYKDGSLIWHFDLKGWFTTAALFIGSIWFYWVRFAKFNPSHSLAPSIAAHMAKNVGVIAIKGYQGHLAGLY